MEQSLSLSPAPFSQVAGSKGSREGGRKVGVSVSEGGMEESEWGIKRLPAAVDTAWPPSLFDRLGELRPSTQIELGRQGLTGRIDTLSEGFNLYDVLICIILRHILLICEEELKASRLIS